MSRSKRHRDSVETSEYLGAARRFIRAAGRRVADADEHELHDLLELQQVLADAIQDAVDGQLAMGKSWSDIARATGKTPQAAHKRWSHKHPENTP
ncbi:hypothetical protein [Curtobacterium oceanosedimentum]|uniref:hypothetical protein n=1 Tax=Curtobacterium oceanosedimentum TaxID=465820 RepID=UPI003394B22D